MAFLLKDDLYQQILQDELSEITRDDDTLINSAISAALALMKSYLFDSYDTGLIFSKTGSDRHGLLVSIGADIVIYNLVARVQAGINIDDRTTRYKNAMNWLRMVKKQENYDDLPLREKTQQEHVKFGSNRKRSNYF